MLARHGQTGLPVHFVGKAATFNLLYAFPLLLLGDGDERARPSALPIGWAFAWWGDRALLARRRLYVVQAAQVVVGPSAASAARMAPCHARTAPTPPPHARGVAPDESMTLLTAMMERPLDPGYAAAAERRDEAGLPAAPARRTPRIVLVAALVVGLLLDASARSRCAAAARQRPRPRRSSSPRSRPGAAGADARRRKVADAPGPGRPLAGPAPSAAGRRTSPHAARRARAGRRQRGRDRARA